MKARLHFYCVKIVGFPRNVSISSLFPRKIVILLYPLKMPNKVEKWQLSNLLQHSFLLIFNDFAEKEFVPETSNRSLDKYFIVLFMCMETIGCQKCDIHCGIILGQNQIYQTF